jgi:hypothetical protein
LFRQEEIKENLAKPAHVFHPISTGAGSAWGHGSAGIFDRARRNRDVIAPTAEEDAYPFERQGTDGGVMTLSFARCWS